MAKKYKFVYIDGSPLSPEDYYYRNENLANYFHELSKPPLNRGYSIAASWIRNHNEVITSGDQIQLGNVYRLKTNEYLNNVS